MLSGRKRVLVLGGTGFIGNAVTLCLLRQGFSVRVLARSEPEPGSQLPEVEFLATSLRDAEPDLVLSDVDVVVSLVGHMYPLAVERSPAEFVEQILSPLVRLFQSASRKQIKCILGSSGGTVYGRPRANPVSETAPAEPISHYGTIMRFLEVCLVRFREEFTVPHLVLRMSNVYGIGQKASIGYGLIPTIMECLEERRVFRIWGDGSMVRDFVYVDDVSRAFLRAVAYRGDDAVFNIGSGVGITVNDVVRLAEEVTQSKLSVEHVSLSEPIHIPRIVLDVSLASRVLDWQPAVSLSDGLRAVWASSSRGAAFTPDCYPRAEA